MHLLPSKHHQHTLHTLSSCVLHLWILKMCIWDALGTQELHIQCHTFLVRDLLHWRFLHRDVASSFARRCLSCLAVGDLAHCQTPSCPAIGDLPYCQTPTTMSPPSICLLVGAAGRVAPDGWHILAWSCMHHSELVFGCGGEGGAGGR